MAKLDSQANLLSLTSVFFTVKGELDPVLPLKVNSMEYGEMTKRPSLISTETKHMKWVKVAEL